MEPDAGQSGTEPQSPLETEETQSQGDEEQERSVLKQSQSDGEDDVDNDMTQLHEPQVDDSQLPETLQKTVQDTVQNTMYSDTDEASSDQLQGDMSPPRLVNLASPSQEEKNLPPPTRKQSQPQPQARTKEEKGKEREVDSVPQIQVPPSTPRSTQSGQAAKPNRLSQNRPSQKPASTTNTSETLRNGDDSRSSPSIDDELPMFDWVDLDDQFTKEIEGFAIQEEELQRQIEQYGQLLDAWAAGAARRDTNRAAKRQVPSPS